MKNNLAFTKEAALVRSIMNASMMYLIVKICSEHTNYSCGCQTYQEYSEATDSTAKIPNHHVDPNSAALNNHPLNDSTVDHMHLSQTDFAVLDSGAPIQLTKAFVRRQGKI